jgi:hypothetical protein
MGSGCAWGGKLTAVAISRLTMFGPEETHCRYTMTDKQAHVETVVGEISGEIYLMGAPVADVLSAGINKIDDGIMRLEEQMNNSSWSTGSADTAINSL